MDRLRLQPSNAGLPDEMLDKAKHVWKMLDELATTDPAAYKNYIQKTLKEGKDYMSPPQPYIAIRSNLMSHRKIKAVYLNIFTWQRLSAPVKDEYITKIYSLTPIESKFNNELCIIINVAIHPDVPKIVVQNQLIRSTFDLISSEHKLLVSYDDYQVLQDKFVGNLSEIQQNFVKPLSKGKAREDPSEELIDNGLSPSLANEISKMATSEKTSNQEKKPTKPTVLIEEIWNVPQFSEEIVNNNSCLSIRVFLPGCQSVSDCDVSVLPREETVQVECSSLQTRLILDMKKRTKPILPSNCSSHFDIQRLTAKFVRKTQQLILNIPINVESKFAEQKHK